MSAKFRYSTHTKDFSKNSSLSDEDKASSADVENKTEASTTTISPAVTEGLSMLVDFIRKHTKQKILENDPDYIKKNKAISAYKKTKGAA